jgi:hypothetical protein
MVTTSIHRPIPTALHAFTSKAVSNPRRTIGAVAVLSVVLFVVGVFTNFNIDVDDDTVWTPSGARPVQHSKWIHDESSFPAEKRLFFLIFHSDGDNAFGQDEVKRVVRAVDAVRGLEGYDTMCGDSHYVNDFMMKLADKQMKSLFKEVVLIREAAWRRRDPGESEERRPGIRRAIEQMNLMKRSRSVETS